ncbi:MAG: hypothetical protein K0R51_1384 [Cytophagaceae bacterium]|jgi:hypothetical protein|nr:hypothetical protein [Cytophagaceae bacterium]
MNLPQRYTYPSPGFSEHWNHGSGKKMLAQLSTIPSQQQIENSAQLYSECDTFGDEIIRDVFQTMGHRQAHELLNEILKKGIDQVPDVPESLAKLFQEAQRIPDWLDEELLEAGAAFCRRTGPFGLIVLRNYSLMGGYESSAINKPLIYTGALKKGAAKRMAETLSFWVDVTGKQALKPYAIGFNTTLHVRIIHALARSYVRKAPTWSDEQWGVPLNHGDMIATNLGFSLVFLDGLRKQGFTPSLREVNGLFHLWKYIGYLLGIPLSYLPDNEEQAIERLYEWTMNQPAADTDTIALAQALMNAPLLSDYPPFRWQKKLLVKIYLGYYRYFLGKNACERMMLPNSSFRFLPPIVAFINSIHEKWVWSSPPRYQKSDDAGRKQQLDIRRGFLKENPFERTHS